MPTLKKQYRLKIPSHKENLELIRNFVSNIARKVGFNNDDVNKIELAVDEACTNVIEHAYKHNEKYDINIAIKIDYQKLTIIITDRGKSFNPKDIELPEMESYLAELRVGGLGIYLMKTLMDKVEYRSKARGENEVRMIKYFLKK